MLFHWLAEFILLVVWLFRPPEPRDLARVDPNAACPVCGARKGHLRCVYMQKEKQKAANMPVEMAMFCQHTCVVCGARCYEEPIVKAKDGADKVNILTAIARNEIEKEEDRIPIARNF